MTGNTRLTSLSDPDHGFMDMDLFGSQNHLHEDCFTHVSGKRYALWRIILIFHDCGFRAHRLSFSVLFH